MGYRYDTSMGYQYRHQELSTLLIHRKYVRILRQRYQSDMYVYKKNCEKFVFVLPWNFCQSPNVLEKHAGKYCSNNRTRQNMFFLLKKMNQINYIFIIIYSFMIYYLYIRLYEVLGISIVSTEMQILLLWKSCIVESLFVLYYKLFPSITFPYSTVSLEKSFFHCWEIFVYMAPIVLALFVTVFFFNLLKLF